VLAIIRWWVRILATAADFFKFQCEIPRVKLSKMVIARPKELEPATSKLDRVGPTTTPTVAVRLEYHA
jgi:hypothetical protein